jgi:hypothetical protein
MRRWIVNKLRWLLGFPPKRSNGPLEAKWVESQLAPRSNMRSFQLAVSNMSNGSTVVLTAYDPKVSDAVEIGRVVHADGNLIEEIAAVIAEFRLR